MALGFLGKALLGIGGGLGSALGLGTKGGRKFLFGEKAKAQQFPTLSPEQIQHQNQILQGLGQATPEAFARLTELLRGDPEALEAFQAPALQQFQRDIIPEITERFGAQSGSQGALSASGLNLALAQAAKDLGVDLAGLRGNLQLLAMSQLSPFSQLGLQSRFSTGIQPATGGFFGAAAPAIGQAFSQYGIPAMTGLRGGQPTTQRSLQSLSLPPSYPLPTFLGR